ncbi:MAG TPA: hypothetical protein DEQ14_00110, partial [Treponema sp.]|nr:hypothetical protein [Treponema sp.]
FISCNQNPADLSLYRVEEGELLESEWHYFTEENPTLTDNEIYTQIHASPEERKIAYITLAGAELLIFILDDALDSAIQSLDEKGHCLYLYSTENDEYFYCFIEEIPL